MRKVKKVISAIIMAVMLLTPLMTEVTFAKADIIEADTVKEKNADVTTKKDEEATKGDNDKEKKTEEEQNTLKVYYLIYDKDREDVFSNFVIRYPYKITLDGSLKAQINPYPDIIDYNANGITLDVDVNRGAYNGAQKPITKECFYDDKKGTIKIPEKYVNEDLTVTVWQSRDSDFYTYLVPNEFKPEEDWIEPVSNYSFIENFPSGTIPPTMAAKGCNVVKLPIQYTDVKVGDIYNCKATTCYIGTTRNAESFAWADIKGADAYKRDFGTGQIFNITSCPSQPGFENIGGLDYNGHNHWLFTSCLSQISNAFPGIPVVTKSYIECISKDDKAKTATFFLYADCKGPKGQTAQTMGGFFKASFAPPEKLKLTKKWFDENNRYNSRPTSVNYMVDYSNDNEKTWYSLANWWLNSDYLNTKTGNWERTVDVSGCSQVNSKTKFRVTEKAVNNYRPHNGQKCSVNGELYNENDLYTKLSVKKVWDDNQDALHKRPDSIKVNLKWKYSNEPYSAYKTYRTVTLSDANNWYYEFTPENTGGLVRQDSSGIYDWTIVEENISDYEGTSTWTGNYSKGYNLTLTNKLSITGASLIKLPAESDCVKDNPEYSLAGAEYGIYGKKSDAFNEKNLIAKFVTDEKGNGGIINLEPGTYYVKEITVPKAFYEDRSVHEVTVKKGEIATITSNEPPKLDPVGVLLKKHDANTGENIALGDGSLENAEYTIKYYKELLNDINRDPAEEGKIPVRTWVLKTNSNGYVYLDEKFKISGPDLYINQYTGKPGMPIGTVTIQETKAPKGYHLNPEMYIRQFTLDNINDGEQGVDTYNVPEQPERSYQVNIVKKLEGTDIPIPEVEFTHIKPDGTKETVTTDKEGKALFGGLLPGTHKIYESGHPFDVLINDAQVTFTLEKGVMTLVSNTSDADNKMDFTVTDNDGLLTVEDKPNDFTLDVIKVNSKGKRLEGAEFTLFADKDCKDRVEKQTTNNEGSLTFHDLQLSHVYYLKETKAPVGYKIPVNKDGTDIIMTVEVRDSFTDHNDFGLYVNGEYVDGNKLFGYGNVSVEGNEIKTDITVENMEGVKLPETGSPMLFIIFAAGIMLIGSSFLLLRKKINKM